MTILDRFPQEGPNKAEAGWLKASTAATPELRKENAGSHKGRTLDNYTQALHPHLVKEGILITASVVEEEYEIIQKATKYGEKDWMVAKVTLDVTFRHPESGHWFTTRASAYAQNNSDKALGAAYSYALKQALILNQAWTEVGVEEETCQPVKKHESKKPLKKGQSGGFNWKSS